MRWRDSVHELGIERGGKRDVAGRYGRYGSKPKVQVDGYEVVAVADAAACGW